MKSNRYFILAGLLLAVLFAAPALETEETVSGRVLYERLLQRDGLIRFEGLKKIEWTPDGGAYTVFEKDRPFRVDPESGERRPLFDDKRISAAFNRITGRRGTGLSLQDFDFVDGGRKVRFFDGPTAYVFDLSSGRMFFYTPEKDFIGVRRHVYSEAVSPDFTHRCFIRDFDLYVADFEGRETALTDGGCEDLRNGFPDWVYAEEFDQYDAFWWSPDSKKIAYLQFDESPVAKYPLVHDTAPHPRLELQSYPTAGANNPIVRIFIADIETGRTVRVETEPETDVYHIRGQWTRDGREFTYQRLSRMQNNLELRAADPETGRSRLILREEDRCYIDPSFDLTFLEDGRSFLWTSERSGWREIYLYDLSGELIRRLTEARLPVEKIAGVDEKAGWVYFTGWENRGLESHAYRIRLDGSGLARLTAEPGSHSVEFSPNFRYFVDSFESFEQPERTTLHRADGTLIFVLGSSRPTKEFTDLDLIQPEHLTFRSADGAWDLDAVLYKPADFDRQCSYPLILSVYGGPGSKMISDSFLMDSRSQALAQLGFLVLEIDHRGVSRRGKEFQNLQYLNLGQVELEDHIAAVRQLTERPYVDAGRVGIYGGSYGGYLTCMALLKAPDIFHVGVAGSPVTDWRNYDTIYTERYMRRPADNPEGYTKGSCLSYVSNLKGRLFIHHGAVDDNVHPGNTIQLARALLEAGKRFDLMVYPEQRHRIDYDQYGESRLDYFLEHLLPGRR